MDFGMVMVVFIHCYKINNLEEILNEQLDYIEKSGLKENAEIKICFSNSREETILKVYEFAQKNNSYFLWMHVKGVGYYKTEFEESTTKFRRWLMDGVVGNWKEYVSYLEEYDVVGDNFKDDALYKDIWPDKYSKQYKTVYPKHFSGTMFWTKSEYLKTLESPDSYIKRYSYNRGMGHETWPCSGKGKFKEVRKDYLVEPHKAWNR